MSSAYLGIGSNIGNTRKNIEKSIELLKSNPQIIISAISSFYETAPIGYTDQDWFLNIVIEIDTRLNPYELLDYCNHIEKELKRERIIHWGPRTIDVDILLYEGFSSNDEKLIVPHPRMCERAFVMIPLYEIAKELTIHNKKIKDIVENLKDEEVRKIDHEQ